MQASNTLAMHGIDDLAMHGIDDPAMHGVDDPAVKAAVRAYVKLLRASRAVAGRVEPRMTGACLTPIQFGVLEAVLHKGPMTQRELGDRVLTSAGNMTDVIGKLEGHGLLRRVRLAGDRRCVQVELTPCGRGLVERLFPEHARDIAVAMGRLDAGELQALDGLLRKLGTGQGAKPCRPPCGGSGGQAGPSLPSPDEAQASAGPPASRAAPP